MYVTENNLTNDVKKGFTAGLSNKHSALHYSIYLIII